MSASTLADLQVVQEILKSGDPVLEYKARRCMGNRSPG